MIVLSDSKNLPIYWLENIQRYRIAINWIYVEDNMITKLMEIKDPYVCVWNYHNGPCPWSQHGGDEEWTAIVRISEYCGESDKDRMMIMEYLDCCRTRAEDMGDFRVYTGVHA